MDLTYCKNQLYLIQELWKVIDVIYSLMKGKGLENQGTLKLKKDCSKINFRWNNNCNNSHIGQECFRQTVPSIFHHLSSLFFCGFFFTEERREFGLYTHRSHTYPLSRSGLISCTRAGIIGKARIRTLKMTLVIGKSYTVVTLL